ncbi:MAG: response regulator [Phycisphaerales bacterium]
MNHNASESALPASSRVTPAEHAAASPIVLLIDDQPIFAKTVAHMLKGDPDITLHTCAEGAKAVALAAQLAPTVILQDLHMPDANGLELIDAYRAQEATRQTPLIVLSAEEDATTKAEAFRRGANDYLVKLPDKAELIARIRYHSRSFRLLRMEQALHEAEKRRIEHQRQREVLRARNTLIFGLAKLAESRDTDTGEHLERIAAYCRVLAEQLRATRPEMDTEWIISLQLASSLHDIGKVGIPDAVLLKPGKLEPDERKIIERHPAIGAERSMPSSPATAPTSCSRWPATSPPPTTSGGTVPAIPSVSQATRFHSRHALSASPTSTTLSQANASTSPP